MSVICNKMKVYCKRSKETKQQAQHYSIGTSGVFKGLRNTKCYIKCISRFVSEFSDSLDIIVMRSVAIGLRILLTRSALSTYPELGSFEVAHLCAPVLFLLSFILHHVGIKQLFISCFPFSSLCFFYSAMEYCAVVTIVQ